MFQVPQYSASASKGKTLMPCKTLPAFRTYDEEKDPFDALRKASVTSEEGLPEEAMSPGSTWSNSTGSNSSPFSPLDAPMPNTTAPPHRQIVKSKTFPTYNHEPRLPGIAPEDLGRLLPELLPLDVQAKIFRLQAPFIYVTQSRSLPQYQLQQVFDRNDRISKLSIRRILPHETRSCSVSVVYTARSRSIKYNEDSTLYTMSDFDMKGRSEGALEGSIQLTTGKTLWGGQWTRIWHVTKCKAQHHACNYRGNCEPEKHLLFCVKKGMWEDTEGKVVAHEGKEGLLREKKTGKEAQNRTLEMMDTVGVDGRRSDLLVACWMMRLWMAGELEWKQS